MSPTVYMNIAILILLAGVAAYVAYQQYDEWRFQRSLTRYRARQHAARETFFAARAEAPTNAACDRDERDPASRPPWSPDVPI